MPLKNGFTYTIIGFGRVGAALDAALRSVGGLSVGIYYSRTPSKASAQFRPEVALNTISELKPSDFVFICVPDDAIESVSKLIPTQILEVNGSIVSHVSGSKPSTVLSHLASDSVKIVSSHPLMTFKLNSDESTFKGITVSLEGDSIAIGVLSELFSKMGSNPLIVTPDQKKLLHLAAVITSNFMSSLVFHASEVLKPVENDSIELVRRVLGPLMQKTAENIVNDGYPSALTGPAARGDESTIQDQLELIKSLGISDSIYRELSNQILHFKSHKEG
jgi:predicted short-subunit dehydrogenase-like oxidoreductase (DUF2520 family)